MPQNNRPTKIIRLNYWNNDPRWAAALTLMGDPGEIRMAASPDSFIGIRDDGITLAPGIGNSVNIQGLSHNLKYAGMVQDLPFPLSIIPVTIATPLPKQIIIPPFIDTIKTIADLASMTSMFLR